ncbi:hypothetical protein STEG23_003032, partial [Scotinomys teguina]
LWKTGTYPKAARQAITEIIWNSREALRSSDWRPSVATTVFFSRLQPETGYILISDVKSVPLVLSSTLDVGIAYSSETSQYGSQSRVAFTDFHETKDSSH